MKRKKIEVGSSENKQNITGVCHYKTPSAGIDFDRYELIDSDPLEAVLGKSGRSRLLGELDRLVTLLVARSLLGKTRPRSCSCEYQPPIRLDSLAKTTNTTSYSF